MAGIEDWRVFVAVASQRSFVSAARTLGRSPQAVTRSVAALEDRLGVRLLHRTTRSVSLTSDGERYVERGRHLLAEFDRLEAGGDDRAELTGTLTITAPVLFGQMHVAPLVTEFLVRNPELTVRLVLVDRFVSLVDEGIDLGVRIGHLADSALTATRIGAVRWVVCASPAYLEREGVPESPSDLGRHACIAFEATTPIAHRWSFHGQGRRRAVAVRPRLVVNTGATAIDAALAGLGLVRVLSYQVDRLVAAGKLRIVLAAYEGPSSPIHLIRLPGLQSRAAERFGKVAAKRLAARFGARPR